MSFLNSIFADDDYLPGPKHRGWSIFLISVLGLFIEMLIIRWVSTEIRIFAYLQNTILVVCFLGLGMGCFTSRKPIHFRRMLIALAVLTILLAVPLTRFGMSRITLLLSLFNDLVIWEGAVQKSVFESIGLIAAGLALSFFLMVIVWEIFVPVGRLLGRLMNDHPRPIQAYSINIVGSLAGIALFWLLSSFSTFPFVWFVVAAALCVPFLGVGNHRAIGLALVGVFVAAAWVASQEPHSQETVWSPYQKLVLLDADNAEQRELHQWAGQHLILVNNAGYQGIIDLREETVRSNKDIPEDRHGLSQYDIPMLFHAGPRRVLIVGAGSGNDVAGALRGGAEEVVAVEIDPAIIEMGRRRHPEQPYDSPRVQVVTDDARSFFNTCQRKFDVIIFGLLDSHTTTSMTNARLDHYVYTQESIHRAASLLDEGGVMVLSFEAQKTYIADRMARCLRDQFGAKPLIFRVPKDSLGWGGLLFVTGDQDHIQTALAGNPRLAGKIEEWRRHSPVELSYTTQAATDDWPYIYLESRQIPVLYWCLAGLMGLLAYYCHRRLEGGVDILQWRKSHWHFFFLGAAFLLLEVQNVSKAAVALGNTWQVNAVIVSGIMLMILLANLIAAAWPKLPIRWANWGLIGSCLALYFIDLSDFAGLPYAAKAVLVGTLTTLPMLFSGILFIRAFSVAKRKDLALGANMFGALVGGLLQSITFVIGVKALLLVVAGLYLAALALQDDSVSASGEVSGEPQDESSSQDTAELLVGA